MIPPCDHTGMPRIEFDGFRHLTSSTTSGSACSIRTRIRSSISTRQSFESFLRAPLDSAGNAVPVRFLELRLLDFMLILNYVGQLLATAQSHFDSWQQTCVQLSRLRLRRLQSDTKAAAAWCIEQHDIAAVQSGEVTRDGQADACAAGCSQVAAESRKRTKDIGSLS